MNDFHFRTKRLIIRPLRLADLEVCKHTVTTSDILRHDRAGTTLVAAQTKRRDFAAMVRRRLARARADREYILGAFRKTDGAFIGELMLYDIRRNAYQSASIGTYIYSPFRGAGYGTEATRGMLRFGWRQLNLNRIEGQSLLDNHTSHRMCLNAGFEIECVSRRRLKVRGKWMDMVILAARRT